MKQSPTEKHDVVVVGAGPAGLTAAVALARAGVDVLVVERRPTGSELPRATVLSLRTMEVLRAWGLEERVLERADQVDMTLLEMPSVARAAEGVTFEVGLPSTAQSAVVSPTAVACVAQDHLDDVLLDHLATLPTATVERGLRVVAVSGATAGAGATVSVQNPAGRERDIGARYVIGADGARSAVRDCLGIAMRGPETVLVSTSVEFRAAALWDALGEHRHIVYTITGPGAGGVLLPAGQGDRWLFGLPVDDALEPGPVPTPAELEDHILRTLDVPGLEIRIERVGRFASGTQLADSYSRGPVYLVGDAAHRVTPRGGTGLNIAIGDGFDLGWKLAWVLRGWADEALLASYERERRPAAAHNVARSADPMGSRREVITEMLIDLGGRIQHVWAGDPLRSSLDLIGEGLTLFTTTPDDEWRDAVETNASTVPITVVPLDPTPARSLGIAFGGALLVRPDGRAVASWQTPARAADVLSLAAAEIGGVAGPEAASPRDAA